MSVIYYERRRGALECAKISVDGSKTLELRFEEKINGSVRLGKTLKKIDGKLCIFDTGTLEDGIYAPLIHLERGTIEPEAFELCGGVPKLIPRDDAYVRELSRESEIMRREIAKIKETLRRFDEKINGNPIF